MLFFSFLLPVLGFTAEKYEATLTFDFRRKLNQIDPSWAAYLELLSRCKFMLMEKKVNIFL